MKSLSIIACLLLMIHSPVCAQDEVLPPGGAVTEQPADTVSPATTPATGTPATGTPATETADELKQKTTEAVEEIAKTVDKNESAQEAASGILKPIYLLAEKLSFPAFHWCAFMLMVSGVVGFAFQLVLTKLVVLTKLGLSFSEIISDAVGLIISLIGLVLTTQAATENSTFTQSPAAVLSATIVGALFGFILYRWGQSAELQALKGRNVVDAKSVKK